jgi:hypothetical protein
MQSLKITWIKRLILSSERMWFTLFNDSITYSNNLCLRGPNFLKKFKPGNLNLFWKDVFISWNNILMKYNPQNCKELAWKAQSLHPTSGTKGPEF